MNLEKSQKDELGIFDWTDKSKLRPSQKLVLNYTGGLKIDYKENVQKTFSKNGYYLAGPFSQEKGSPAHLMLNDQQYYIHKIYVLAKEVIIQHKPVMNGTDLTLRIPIISANPKNKKYTSIDRLLSSIPLVSLQLNNLLKEGALAALYSGGTVLYLETGISIKTIVPEKNVVNPFEEIGVSLFEPDYVLVPVHLGDDYSFSGKDKKELPQNPVFADIQEGMQEGMDEDMDDFECTPYDIGADNIQFMQVPIADEAISNQANKNTMFGILYLFYMGVIVMALCFLAPLVVKSTVLTLGEKSTNVFRNVKSLFILFFLSIFITSIFITLDGSDRHNVEESKAGLIIFFIAFTCCAMFVVYTTLSGILNHSDGSSWEIGNMLEFLFECLPFKKYRMVFTFFVGIFLILVLSITIDEKYMKGKFSMSPNLIVWGIFMSFSAALFIAYISGKIDLNVDLRGKTG